MAEVINNAQQEFWRSPALMAAEPLAETSVLAAPQTLSEACADCGTEFMIGARFCHTCGLQRPPDESTTDVSALASVWPRSVTWLRGAGNSVVLYWREAAFPGWLQYLHFHEIQRVIGLPTASLVAFMIGLGCVTGAIGVSLFYKASNLAEFQAIQMWRIEWLLAATASFVAGILLKKTTGSDND
jgi:hypothetical protein